MDNGLNKIDNKDYQDFDYNLLLNIFDVLNIEEKETIRFEHKKNDDGTYTEDTHVAHLIQLVGNLDAKAFRLYYKKLY